MVLLRFMDPDHVVIEKIVTIGRREPLMREARPADHHNAKLADFGLDA
jgi:hypothetical protein